MIYCSALPWSFVLNPVIRPVHILGTGGFREQTEFTLCGGAMSWGYVPPAAKGPLALWTPMTLTRGYVCACLICI